MQATEATIPAAAVPAAVSSRPAGRRLPHLGSAAGPGSLLLIAATVWAVVLAALAIRRHDAFRSYLHDLGIFEHLIWNTAHGFPFDSSIYAGNYLGVHFSPALLIFVPGYLLWPDARALLVMQAAVIALAAWPFYRLARRWLGRGRLALAAGFLVLLNPYNLFLALTDFHPDVLALPLLACAFWALDARRDRWAVAALVALLLVREDFALAVAGVGLYVALGQGRRRFGVALVAGSSLYLAVLVLAVLPAIAGQPYAFADLNPDLGSGPFGLIAGVLTDPLATLRHVSSEPRPEYLIWLLGPLAGLPLLRPLHLLPGLPLLARNLLAAHPSRVWINRHYHAAIVPAFWFAALAALAALPRRWARRAALAALAASLAFDAYALIGLAGSELRMHPRAEAYQQALALVPPDAPVAASNHLGAHLADRRFLSFFPADGPLLGDPTPAEWVVVDLADRAAWLRETSDAALEERLRATFPPDRYDEVYRSGPVLVLRARLDRADR